MARKTVDKTLLADIVFVIDATSSTQPILFSVVDKVEDIGYEMEITNRKADCNFGAVIYRDPVDYKYVAPIELTAEEKKVLDEVNAKAKIFRDEKLRELECDVEEYDKQLNERRSHFDRNLFPFDKNVAIDLKAKMTDLVDILKKVEAGAGNDEPEDWVGALDLALHSITWRKNSKRAIVWISDANAHGKMYCGYDNHNEEEPKLEPLVREMAEMNIHFVGLNLIRNNDNGCEQTLTKIREIYQNYGAKTFSIEKYVVPPIQYLDSEMWPDNIMDGLIQTIDCAFKKMMTKFDDSEI